MTLAQAQILYTWLEPQIAKLQAKVGEMIAAKYELVRMRRAVRTPQDIDALERSLATQAKLEASLPGLTAVIERFKAGQIDLATVTSAINFIGTMDSHLRDVKNLRIRFGKEVEAAETPTVDWKVILLFAAGAGGALWIMSQRPTGGGRR